MAGNSATLTFAGDADSLRRAAQQSTQALDEVSAAARDSAAEMSQAGSESTDFTTKIGHLGGAVSGATDALDSIGGSLTAVNDIMNLSANRAAEQKRKLLDVEQAAADLDQAYGDLRQAQLDLTQSFIDAKQGGIDVEQSLIDAQQAALDATVAQDEYNAAVKEHGAGSAEAQQAAIDLRQAQADLAQAQLDGEQAQNDINQALEDGNQARRDATQANIDARTSQLDLNDAMRAANPPTLEKWAQNLEMVTPLITAAVGIIGLLTAAQWMWNASLWASPITWIVVAVAAVIAGVIILATHTKELGEVWDIVWGGITDAAVWAWDKIKAGASMFWDHLKAVWAGLLALPGQLKSAFTSVTGFITAPFRAAFNYVSDAWNGTIGRLSWTVPGWVPGVGGNSISAPRLPKYHQGGTAPGGQGAEFLAILQAGETVSRAGGDHPEVKVVVELVGDGVLRVVRTEVGRRGSVERALGGDRG